MLVTLEYLEKSLKQNQQQFSGLILACLYSTRCGDPKQMQHIQ